MTHLPQLVEAALEEVRTKIKNEEITFDLLWQSSGVATKDLARTDVLALLRPAHFVPGTVLSYKLRCTDLTNPNEFTILKLMVETRIVKELIEACKGDLSKDLHTAGWQVDDRDGSLGMLDPLP